MLFIIRNIIIAIGVLKGYQLCKGKIDQKLPIFIVIISIITISVSTLLIIPLCLLAKEGLKVDANTLQFLYANQEFVNAITRDYVVSLLFTFLGISGVVANTKKQIQEGKDHIEVSIQQEQNSTIEKDDSKIKEIFIKYNALDKNTAIEKETIFKEMDTEDEKKFKQLKMQQIILKHKGKYYFSLKNEKSLGRRFLLLYGKIMLWICLFIIVLFLFL